LRPARWLPAAGLLPIVLEHQLAELREGLLHGKYLLEIPHQWTPDTGTLSSRIQMTRK